MLTEDPLLEQSNNLVIATVPSHELTLHQTTALVEEFMNRMRCDNAQFFLIDLSAVEFLPSICLGTLVQFLQDLEHVRGRIGLVGCRPNVQFLFKVTRLDSVFPLFDDMSTAKAQIVGG